MGPRRVVKPSFGWGMKMRVLGLRAEPSLLHWAIVEGSAENPILVDHDKAKPPVHVEEPEMLNWYRKRLAFLVEKYGAKVVGVRYQETHGRRGNVDSICRRSRIEGVLTEGAFAAGVPVVVGTLNQISARLHTKSAKHYLDEGELRGLDLATLPPNRREAVLVGVAALAAQE
jgi:hypothetical protein